MFGKKEIISIGRIDPNPDQPEIPKTQEKNVENKDQKSLEVSYLQKQIAAFESYKEMIGSEKGTDAYKRLREEWMKKREAIADYEKNLPESLLEEYASKYNLSEAKARKRLQELGGAQTEPTPSETKTSWRSLWALGPGDKLPKEVTEADIKKHIEMVGKSQGKETLAYAYAKTLLENLQEQPAREEAETHRDEVEDLEAEEKQLQKELQKEKGRKIEVFEAPNDAEVSKKEKQVEEKTEQVEEKKKKVSWGEKFKKGVKGFFDKFKKENKKEEKKLEKVVEKAEEKVQAKTPEEKIASGEEYLDESGFVHNRKEGRFLGGEWVDERLKGFAGGFGWWESHQAEKFRLGTKEAGADAKAQTALAERLMEKEAGLLDEGPAWEEALEVEKDRALKEKQLRELFKGARVSKNEVRHLAIMELSNKISGKKIEKNQKIEDEIVAMAMAKLEEKIGGREWFGAYKAANGGRALTPEKAQELEKKIREQIGELRNGKAAKDLVDFTKLARQSLDKNWWHRYVYTGIDAVLAGLMLKWVVGKYLGGKAVAGAEKIAAKGGGKEAIETVRGLKKHVWGDTDNFISEYLNKKGVGWDEAIKKLGFHSKDEMLQHFSEIVAKDSGPVAVKAWKMAGKIVDTQMPGGYLLKFGKVAAELGTKLAL